MPPIPYKLFQIRNPEWDGPQWRKARALYAGGKKLLEDDEVMSATFPRHLAEEDKVYAERKNRAFYIPYAGEIIDQILAALFDETLTIDPLPDQAYERLMANATQPLTAPQDTIERLAPRSADKGKTFFHVLRKQVLTAMLCQRAWTQVDLPRADGRETPASLGEEQRLGLLNPYLICVDPEMVVDWETDDRGSLTWVLVCHKTCRRQSIGDARDTVEERYTHYTAKDWSSWSISYKKDKPPSPDDPMTPLDENVPHSFGRVPFARLELPDGLYVMGKIDCIAVAHFNTRNALSWAELKSLFPVMASFKTAPDPLAPLTEDPDRDINQVYGAGRIVGFAEKDDLRFVGPDTAPFAQAAADLVHLRDEMHRVLHHMALSVDNSAAALQRSADSKQVDQAATKVILRAFGQHAKEHAIEIFNLAAAGRGEEYEFVAEGMDTYDDASIDVLLAQAEVLDTIQVPSPTFKQLYFFEIARRFLGDGATQEDLKAIKNELQEQIEKEMLQKEKMIDHLAVDDDGDDDADEGDEDDQDS